MKDLCECGHLKECHQPHQLDMNGGECSHCDCKIFTWISFFWTDEEKKNANSGGKE